MPALLIPSRYTQQPQQAAPIDWGNPLARGLVFSTSDPLAPVSASGHSQAPQGSGFVRAVTKDGRTVAAGADQTTTGVIVLPAAVRDALVGKPITVAWVGDGARSSAAAQAVYCHRDGSTQAFYVGANAVNVQYAVAGFSDVLLNAPNLATATRFVLTADGVNVTLYTDGVITSAPGAGMPAATTILPSILNRISGGRGNSSNIANISVWNRALSAQEVQQWQANPWQVSKAAPRRLWAAASAPAAISGALSWAEGSDTSTLAAAVTDTGTLAWTEAGDVASIAAAAIDRASMLWTEQGDTASLAGVATDRASIAWTEQGDSAALTGAVANNTGPIAVSTALNWTEAGDTAALSALALDRLTLAWAEQGDIWALIAFADQPPVVTATVRFDPLPRNHGLKTIHFSN